MVAGLSGAKPPRLFRDTFSYAAEIVDRLAAPRLGERIFLSDRPHVIREKDQRLIRMKIPDDMRTRDSFGFASEGAVDGRFMPPEAVGSGDRIELTDQPHVVSKAVADAKMQDRAWPEVQFLWDVHPILEWFADSASEFFPDHSAPVASLSGVLAIGEVVVILHGAIPNEKGAPIVDRWAAMVGIDDGPLQIEEVDDFLDRTGIRDKTPNRGLDNLDSVKAVIPCAVGEFQRHLNQLRREREKEIETGLSVVLDRLAKLESRFKSQLSIRFDARSEESENELSLAEKRVRDQERAKEREIDRMFGDWVDWHERTRRMADDPNPHVDVVAVFKG